MKEFWQKRVQWNPEVKIIINEDPKYEEYRKNVVKCDAPIFSQGDPVTGKFVCTNEHIKPIGHKGITLSLIGRYITNDNRELDVFLSDTKTVMMPGEIQARTALEAQFNFHDLEFPTTSYAGEFISAEYFVEFRVSHTVVDYVVTQPITIVHFDTHEENEISTCEIGIQGVLHIEFIFAKKWHDIMEEIIGKIFFLRVKLRIVNMELTLCRKETYKSDDIDYEDITELRSFEIMDGAVCRGDSVPVRFFSANTEIHPMNAKDNMPFRVTYFMQVILKDENGKTYYRKLKVKYFRRAPEPSVPLEEEHA